MSLNMECYNLEHLIDTDEEVQAMLFLAAESGKKIRAYSGLYSNKYYGALQIVVGEIINHEKKCLEIQSGHTHNSGNSFWKCRVLQEINPDDSGELEMRLLVEHLSGEKSMTVVDVVNADILPSYSPGEIIDLQVIAKARSAKFYPDENAFCEAEGQKVSIPMSMDGKREEKFMSLSAGFPMPSGFMHNHTVEDGKEGEGCPNTDDDKWIYLRGEIKRRGYYPCNYPGKNDEELKIPLFNCQIDTYFGKIHIMFNAYGISKEQRDLFQVGNTVSAVCNIQGDALMGEYDEGIVIDKKNNLMALRYALSSGRFCRLEPVLAENCILCSEDHEETITGSGNIIQYFADEHNRFRAKEQFYTLYGIIENSDSDTAEFNLERKAGERCIVIGVGEESERQISQIVFVDYDKDEKICRIRMASDSHYKFRNFRSWAEMEEFDMDRKGVSTAVFRKEKVFVDYLNRTGDYDIVADTFRSILDKNVILEYGTSHYEGLEKVLEFLENTSRAISTDEGFTARPVKINESESWKKAVALCSKLEEYVSWYFFLEKDAETGKVNKIRGKQGQEHTHSIDFYEERPFDYDSSASIREKASDDMSDKDEEDQKPMSPEENRIRIAVMIAEAYTTGDFEPLFPLMTNDYEHHSFWVAEPMVGKKTVIPYYRGKGNSLKNSNTKVSTKLVRILEPQPKAFPGQVYVNGEKMKPETRLAVWSDIGSICVLMRQILDGGEEVTTLAMPTINEEGHLTRLLITEPALFTFEDVL